MFDDDEHHEPASDASEECDDQNNEHPSASASKVRMSAWLSVSQFLGTFHRNEALFVTGCRMP